MSSQPQTALGMCFIMNIDWEIEIFMGQGWCELGAMGGGGLMVWNCIPSGRKWKRKNSSWSGSLEASFWDAQLGICKDAFSKNTFRMIFYFGLYWSHEEKPRWANLSETILKSSPSAVREIIDFTTLFQNALTLDFPLKCPIHLHYLIWLYIACT